MPGGYLGLLGTIGGTFANVISNRDTNATNIYLQQMANDMNWQINQANLHHADQAATTAYQRQVDFYNRFQSPSAMMQQIKEAGLSPGLMYGQGGAGGSGGTSVAQAATPSPLGMQAAQVRPLLDAQIAMMLSQVEKTKAETRKDNADAARAEGELPKIKQETINLQETQKQIQENIRKTSQEIENLAAEQAKTFAEANKINAEKDLTDALKIYKEKETELLNIEIKYADDLNNQKIEEIKAHIKEMNAAAAKMGAESKAIREQNIELVKLYRNQAQQVAWESKYLLPYQAQQVEALTSKTLQEIINAKTENERNAAVNRMWEGMKKAMGGGEFAQKYADFNRWLYQLIPSGGFK